MKKLGGFVFLVLLFFLLSLNLKLVRAVGANRIVGEKKVWYPLELWFEGPSLSETNTSPNPFLDYRLEVVFTNGGKIYKVPGFFAGDGSGGSSGNIWKVRFTPDLSGGWSYNTSFRQGNNIAIETSSSVGNPVSFNGASGSFNVASRDSGAPGFLKWGRLEFANNYYLKFRDGPHFIKGGTDSPENFLAYSGFDDTSPRGDGGVWYGFHDYDSHQGINGALEYLASKRVNSIYLLLNNIGGDGQDVWPFAPSINRSGGNDNTHFDISKLDQWEAVFKYAQSQGINLNMVLCEGEEANKKELDNTSKTAVKIGLERKLFTREIIARFAHHNALEWMLCEEYDHSYYPLEPELIKDWAGYVKEVDPYDHPVGVHNMGFSTRNNSDALDPFFDDQRFDFTSFQYHGEGFGGEKYSSKTENLRNKAINRKIAINFDETVTTKKADSGECGGVPFGQNATLFVCGQSFIRKNVIYPIYFSGGGLELILQDLLATDDFSQYDRVWDYLYYARKFMQDNLPFTQMSPHDELLSGTSVHGDVLALPGSIYAVYLPFWGTNKWAKESKNSGNTSNFTGNGYYRWDGPNHLFEESHGVLEYKINITDPGTYHLRMRVAHDNPVDQTDANDCFVKMDSGDWFKAFQTSGSGGRGWKFDAQLVFDHDASDFRYGQYNLSKGVHTFKIAGRSTNFYIDRIQFYKNGLNNPPFSTLQSARSGGIFQESGGKVVIEVESVVDSGPSSEPQLNLASGSYQVKWYNPRAGGALQNGSKLSVSGPGAVSLGRPPGDSTQDWVVLVSNGNLPPTPTNTPIPTDQPPSCFNGQGGNLNCDLESKIDELDLAVLLSSWRENPPVPDPSPGHFPADLNTDNKVNQSDLAILLSHWLVGSGETPQPSSTPTSQPPTATPTLSNQQQVVSFTLINADTNQAIKTLSSGETIDLSSLPTQNLNIRANTNPGVVGSVVFRLDSNLRYCTESSAPYALAGDSPIGDYLSWTPAQGDHLVVATPYSQANAKGGAGSSLAITFTVN